MDLMDTQEEQLTFEALKNQLNAYAKGDEPVPDVLKDSRWWRAYKELYETLGENCVLLNKVALGFYLNERSIALQIL